MKVLHAQSVEVREMVRALGLDPSKVGAITIRIRPGDIVTVHVKHLLVQEEGQAFTEKWRRYALTPLEPKK